MPTVTITLDEEVKKILQTRAKKNFFTLKEQVEDILRTSALRSKKSSSQPQTKVDDKLVAIFSRDNRGKKPRQNKK